MCSSLILLCSSLKANIRGVLKKEVFLKTLQNLQENTCDLDNAAAIYYKTKAKLNINSSLLFINILNNLLNLKSTRKQDSSIFSSHRAIILGKSII